MLKHNPFCIYLTENDKCNCANNKRTIFGNSKRCSELHYDGSFSGKSCQIKINPEENEEQKVPYYTVKITPSPDMEKWYATVFKDNNIIGKLSKDLIVSRNVNYHFWFPSKEEALSSFKEYVAKIKKEEALAELAKKTVFYYDEDGNECSKTATCKKLAHYS